MNKLHRLISNLVYVKVDRYAARKHWNIMPDIALTSPNMYGANRRLVVEQKALAGILGHTYNLLAFRKHVMRERAIQRRLQYKTTMDTFKAAMIAGGADGYATDNEALYLQAWQHLIDTGTCWQLQGWFGRTARDLIESGQCRPAHGGAA